MIKFFKRLDFGKIAIYLTSVVLFGMTVWGVASCANNKRDVGRANELAAQAKQGFVLPAIPAALTDPAARAEYLATHFWDNFDFADTTLCSRAEITEQAFVDYLDILPHARKEVADNSIRTLLQKCEPDSTMRACFTDLIEKYLHDPNSPLRNEEFYITAMEYVTNSPRIPDIEKLRPRAQLVSAYKNRVGTVANNFSYMLNIGGFDKMHNISAQYLLIYFHNPDCHDCERVREALKSSETITRLQEQHRLKILAVYPDEDLFLWKAHSNEIPKEWINSHNLHIKDDLYNLPAIPSLYLLDRDKIVLLKDATFEQVEESLKTLVPTI